MKDDGSSQATRRVRDPGPAGFIFGDSPESSERLLELVRIGKKVATCATLRDYQQEGEPLPTVGEQAVALNWDATPALVIETTSVDLVRFCDVDGTFALAEGENDSLEGWREEHRDYFSRNGGFDPEMILVCQRFRVVQNLQRR